MISFSALWSQIQPHNAITELEIELNITSSPSVINNPGDSSNSSWGNNNDGTLPYNNDGTSLAGPSLGTSHSCLLSTFIGTSLAVGIGTSLSLGASPSTLLGTLLGTSLESVTMSHWQQQHLPPATTTPHDYIEFRTTVAVTAVEIENEKKVVKLAADDNAMKGSVWLYTPGNDEDDATVTSKYSKEKIDVIVDGDNKEEDDLVDAFDDSNSKDGMFVYTSNIDKDVSGEDQDIVICYEDQAQREDCTDYNNVGINDEGRTQASYKSCMTS